MLLFLVSTELLRSLALVILLLAETHLLSSASLGASHAQGERGSAARLVLRRTLISDDILLLHGSWGWANDVFDYLEYWDLQFFEGHY